METTLAMIKALADGNRLRVVVALMRHDELCVCQIVEMLGLATATISRHMRILQHARLVQSRKEGRWVHYRLAEPFPDFLRKWLAESLAGTPEAREDEKALATILASDPEAVCRRQKMRKGSGACAEL